MHTFRLLANSMWIGAVNCSAVAVLSRSRPRWLLARSHDLSDTVMCRLGHHGRHCCSGEDVARAARAGH